MTEGLFELGPSYTEGWPSRPRYLMSYAYLADDHRRALQHDEDDQVTLAHRYNVDLVIDSGAFTTHASGKQMDHDGYLDWLAEHADSITFALSLDVIGDHHQSAVNHQTAVDRVGHKVRIIPTYHLGSPMSELRRLCRDNRLVSIGGAVPFARQHRHLFTTLKQIHRTAAEHGAQLHGLGMTSSGIIHAFPWASVDSSGWTAPVRFPSLPLANEQGRITTMEHGWRLDREERRLVTAYGGSPELVATPGWSLRKNVGIEEGQVRQEWACTATARSYMYVEAAKNAFTDTPIKIYLSGRSPLGLHEKTIGVIARAHALGNPWRTA